MIPVVSIIANVVLATAAGATVTHFAGKAIKALKKRTKRGRVKA